MKWLHGLDWSVSTSDVLVCLLWASVWQWQEGKAYALSSGYKTKNDRLWMCVCECLYQNRLRVSVCVQRRWSLSMRCAVVLNTNSPCTWLHDPERERCRMKQGSLSLNSPEMDRNLLSLWLECDGLWSSSVPLQPTHNLSTHTTCFSLASVSLSLSRWVNTFYSRSFMRKLIRNVFHPQYIGFFHPSLRECVCTPICAQWF